MQFLVIYVVVTAFSASDELLYAQETDDHKAICALIDREQNANDTGDARLFSTCIARILLQSGLAITMEQRIGSNTGRDIYTIILNGASPQKTGRVVQRY